LFLKKLPAVLLMNFEKGTECEYQFSAQEKKCQNNNAE
jgi:hypothetical protein